MAVTGNGRNTLELTVTGPGGFKLFWVGPNPSLAWRPAATQVYAITVVNKGPGKAAYTLYHN